jgi:hypothetical protein
MKSSATIPEEFLAPDGRTPRLNLDADYVGLLKTLSNRYGWTFGIFFAGGCLSLETARPGTRKAYIAVFGPDPGNVAETPPEPALHHFCETQVQQRGKARGVTRLCELPAQVQVGSCWRCLRHST